MATLRNQVCILLLVLAAASQATVAENVVVLDHTNFDDFIQKNDFVLVEFYAPWCGHCKSLAPEYEKAATMLKEENSNIILANVDADNADNKPLAKQFGVEGFPTLKIFQNSVPREYNGPREAEGIVSYLLKQAGPASTELTTAEEASKFLEENPVASVAILKDFDSTEFSAFKEVAEALRADYSFAHTKDASILPDKGTAPVAPVVRLFKNFDEEFNDIATFDHAELKKTIELKSIPLVVEMSKDPANRPALVKVFSNQRAKALLFFSYDSDVKAPITEAYRAVSKEGKYDIDYIIGDETENSHALEYFGVTTDDSPVLLIHDQSTDKKYTKTDVKPADIEPFIKDYFAGKLVSKTKSQPLPEDNSGPVKVLVAHNFDDIVFKSGKNVMVEFYAEWCGHCKKLAPIYEKVGKAFIEDDTVVVAKIDATANDIPKDKFDVQGFPTLYFVNAQGEISLYQGGRTKKDLVSYITKNKTAPAGSVKEMAEDIAEAAEAALEKTAETVKSTVTGGGKDEL